MICTERKKNMQTHIHPNAEIERRRKSEQEIERQRKSKQEIESEIIIIKKTSKDDCALWHLSTLNFHAKCSFCVINGVGVWRPCISCNLYLFRFT